MQGKENFNVEDLLKKRPGHKYFKPEEITQRFGAKSDFIKYFKVSL